MGVRRRNTGSCTETRQFEGVPYSNCEGHGAADTSLLNILEELSNPVFDQQAILCESDFLGEVGFYLNLCRCHLVTFGKLLEFAL